MTDEMITRIFAALDNAFIPQGLDRFETGMETATRVFEYLAQCTKLFKDREGARAWLQTLPDFEESELANLEQMLPTLAYLVRRRAPDVVKSIPHDPGGRTRRIEPENHALVCSQIHALRAKDVLLRDAFVRIAQQWGASSRTVQRIWNQRRKQKADGG